MEAFQRVNPYPSEAFAIQTPDKNKQGKAIIRVRAVARTAWSRYVISDFQRCGESNR